MNCAKYTNYKVLVAVLALLPFAAHTEPEATPEEVTFSRHIAPIIWNNCVECHRGDTGAPFAFTTYEEVKRRAKLIAYVTETRQMPKWVPDHDADIPFKHRRGLTDAEIALIQAWVAADAPLGNADEIPPLPPLPEEWYLGTPDLVVEMGEAYTVPADGPDIYHNFVIPLPAIPQGKWLKAVEFKASAPSVVHHSLLDLDTTGVAKLRDAEEPGPGYSGMEQRLEDARIATYAVGTQPYAFPEGVAYEVPEGSALVLETHFHPTGKLEHEKSRVGLYLTDEPPTRRMLTIQIPVIFGMATEMDIPPGEPRYELHSSYTMPVDVYAMQAFPHAHYLCREIHSVATLPNGEKRTLMKISDWDFAWQEQYAYAEPILLPAGTVIDMLFVYDNSADNPHNPSNPPQRVTWGNQTTDEMAGCGLDVIPVNDADYEKLHEAFHDFRMQQFRKMDIDYLYPLVYKEILRRYDRNKNGQINLHELPAMVKFWTKSEQQNQGNKAFYVERIFAMRVGGPVIRETIEREAKYYIAGGGAMALVLFSGILYLIVRWFRNRKVRLSH